MLQEILQAFACLFPSQPAAAKATSQSVIERGLRAALPTVDVLPPALSAALLVEEADDVEASAADDAAMQALLRDVMQTTASRSAGKRLVAADEPHSGLDWLWPHNSERHVEALVAALASASALG